MICIKCKRIAEYDSPYPYCLRHWCEWWYGCQPKNGGAKSRVRLDKKIEDLVLKEIKLAMRRIRYKEKKNKV